MNPGDIIRQKYRVERILGRGGMGVVVAAWHLRLEQLVAIKFLRQEVLQDVELVARFLREARAASRIQGDHVARVLDVDTHENGEPFLVMEYLEGTDLSSVRKQNRPLPWNQAVNYVLQACEAISEAHSLGIIHRDIKPANIFLATRRRGQPIIKVLDFGISKMPSSHGQTTTDGAITQGATSLGSPEYMSPEQMQSIRDVDARTDIWSLGTVLYELCTACGPFHGASVMHVCARVMTEEPLSPRITQPDLPLELESIILRCLNKKREGRFSSVDELAAALMPFSTLDGSAVSVRGSVAEPQGTDGTTPLGNNSEFEMIQTRAPGAMTTATPSVLMSMPPARRLILPALAAAAFVVAGFATTVFFLDRRARSADAGAASTPTSTAVEPEPSAAAPVVTRSSPTIEASAPSASASTSASASASVPSPSSSSSAPPAATTRAKTPSVPKSPSRPNPSEAPNPVHTPLKRQID